MDDILHQSDKAILEANCHARSECACQGPQGNVQKQTQKSPF